MGLIKSACRVFFGMTLIANGACAQETGRDTGSRTESVVQSPADVIAFENLLSDAQALMKADQPADAYKLLEPYEFDHAGEVRFDYLIGIAALDCGKADKATLALERVLAVDPDYAGARLDMARAYYQLGDLSRAKTEFEAVLKQSPSGTARATIQNYLDSIAGQEDVKQTLVSAYIEGTAGRDSNVSNASDATSNIVTTLNPTGVEIADYYYGMAVGGEINHSFNSSWLAYAGADVRWHNNKTQKSFDTHILDARIGVIYGTDSNRFRMGVSGGQHQLGGSHDHDTSDFNAEWRHAVSQNNLVNVFGQYMQYRYTDLLNTNDFNQQAMGVGWSHVFENAMLSGNLYYGTEKDVGPITSMNPSGGRIDGTRHFDGFRVGSQTSFGEKAKLYVSMGRQFGHYSNINPLISAQRMDRQSDLTFGANWYPGKLWVVRPQLAQLINKSNVGSYTYDRVDVSLTIRRNFR